MYSTSFVKRFCIVFLLFGLFLHPEIKAQVVPFINITPDARTAGMGKAGTAARAHAFSIYHNAAAPVFSYFISEFAFSTLPYMREINDKTSLKSFAGYYNIDTKQGLLLGFRHFRDDEIPTSDGAAPIRYFTPKEWTFEAAYNRRINKKMAVALTARYIFSDISEKGSAIAFDISGFYKHPLSVLENSYWSAGLQLSNVGTSMKYDTRREALPASIKIGGSVVLPFNKDHIVTGTLDLGYGFSPSHFFAGIGVGYTLFEYGIIRTGFHYGDKDKGYSNYGTLGCGIRFGPIIGDLSYWITGDDNPHKNTFQVTLGFRI